MSNEPNLNAAQNNHIFSRKGEIMKRLIAFVIIVFVLNTVLWAQPVFFADPDLKAVVERELGVSNPTAADMLGLTEILARRSNIDNLTGLEYATNMRTLSFEGNQISDLSPLSGLTKLSYLALNANQISDISSLSGLINLRWLFLDNNQISDISSLSGLTSLNWLGLSNNQISDISPLAGLPSMAELDLRGNPLNQEACDIYIPQMKANGTPVEHDACVIVTVTVPDVVGLPLSQAEQAFWSAGFTTLYETYAHSDVPQGHVISQEPAGGELVPIDSIPEIVISLGPETGETTVEVPDVVGMSASDAASELNSAGLSVGSIGYYLYSDTVPDGHVISQSPGAGTEVDPGTEVDLVISMGPEPEDVPPVPVPPVPVPPVPVEPNASCLLAHWKLDEIEGAIAYDSVGDNDGILYGDPIWQPMGGMLGGALEFDGTDDYVFIDGSYQVPVYTITVWFRVDGGSGNRDVFSAYAPGVQHGILLEIRGDGVLRYMHRYPLGIVGRTDIYTTTTYDDGAWYHAAMVKSADTIALYINGEEVDSAADSSEFNSGDTFGVTLGILDNERAPVRHFPGALDDVRIYDCALDENQIKSLIGLTPSFNTLSEALDVSLSFTTGGSADWFSQTTTTYYDGDAAQSPDISHRQESWMQTTVSGKGTVKFYWMVSSEEDFDFLEFYIDGALQEKTSGSVNWQHKTYTISTSGLHTLEWRYVKDGSGNYGRDCGWVDKVEWVSTP